MTFSVFLLLWLVYSPENVSKTILELLLVVLNRIPSIGGQKYCALSMRQGKASLYCLMQQNRSFARIILQLHIVWGYGSDGFEPTGVEINLTDHRHRLRSSLLA